MDLKKNSIVGCGVYIVLLAQERDQWPALVNTPIKFLVP
jgi:hypothetical protein